MNTIKKTSIPKLDKEIATLRQIVEKMEVMLPSERDRALAYLASRYRLTCPQCGEDYP